MNFRKFTLSFILALSVSCMAVETAWVKTAMALPAPANLTASVTGNKVTVRGCKIITFTFSISPSGHL